MGAQAILVLCFFVTITLLIGRTFSLPAHLMYEDEEVQHFHLDKGDELSSGEIDLQVPIVFYGQTFSTIYVNTNGLLSLTTEIPNFFNIEFPLDYPVIAPLYSNIDTTHAGTITYQETQRPDLLARANENIHDSFSYTSSFIAKSIFIVTWNNVGYHGNGTDKVNTFQVVICSNGEDSFVEFLYPDDGIQWIQGAGDESGLPDARAQVGFVSPDGRHFTLRGSGTDQVQNLNVWSNMNLPGQWLFRIGQVAEEGNVEEPDVYNDDLHTHATSCRQGSTQCHSRAFCQDYANGFCCVCSPGYYGNGKLCVKNDVPLRVNGKISGKVNGEKFEYLDLQSYVVMADARAYTAVSKIPESIGYDSQTFQILGSLIGWLFAKPLNGAVNGYELTGGVFNHTATIQFLNTSQTLTVKQRYTGLDVFDQGRLEADIQGDVPTIPLRSNVSINGYEEQYTMTKPGVIQSTLTHGFKYTHEGEEVVHYYTIDQTILFESCIHGPLPVGVTWRLKVGRNFINYEAREQLVRFGLTNKVLPLGEFDPCKEGRETCGRDSSCIVEGDTFRCVCNPGYQFIYHQGNPNPTCEDINECQTGTHDCDYNAQCHNEIGGYRCVCNPGFEGNGRYCHNAVTCETVKCNENAECVIEGYARCKCVQGYTGNGQHCVPAQEQSCHQANNCSPYGYCTIDPATNRYDCVCLPGYEGNGYECRRTLVEETTLAVETTTIDNEPSPNAVEEQCVLDDCWCPAGYERRQGTRYCEPVPEGGISSTEATDELDVSRPIPQCTNDSQVCFCPKGYNYVKRYDLCIYVLGIHSETKGPSGFDIGCNILNNCHRNAQCVLIPETGKYGCRCNEGFEGNGMECTDIEDEISCLEADICDIHAICDYNETLGKSVCVCNDGYKGDGKVCSLKVGCNRHEDCPENEECKVNILNKRLECECKENFARDADDQCKEIIGVCGGGTCVENAECLYDEDYQTYYCSCVHGYVGDGITICKPKQITCNERNICHLNANCVYDHQIDNYECQCNAGYIGDGITCIQERTCLLDPSMCDRNAKCIRNSERKPVCQCLFGYNGNGTHCEPNPKHDSHFLLLNQGMTTLRVPFEPTRINRGRPIQMRYQQMAIGLDIDCLAGRVYWSDIIAKAIRSSLYNGSAYKDFLTEDIGSPEGIAVDWVSRNVYWTDSTKDTIEVANIDLPLRKVLFSNNLVNPRGIAVHPQRGKIFWSDWDRVAPKLEWANGDGTERQTFLTGNDVQLPNSLAIDWESDELCYADAGTKKIECIHIDSRSKRTIATNCSYPFGLAISDNHYYWTDWQSKKIERVEKHTMKKQTPLDVPLGGSGTKLYGMAAVPDKCPPLVNVCQYSSEQCPKNYLCLPTAGGTRKCVCASTDQTLCNDI